MNYKHYTFFLQAQVDSINTALRMSGYFNVNNTITKISKQLNFHFFISFQFYIISINAIISCFQFVSKKRNIHSKTKSNY